MSFAFFDAALIAVRSVRRIPLADEGSIDVPLLVASNTRGSLNEERWHVIRKALAKGLEFLPIDDSEAIVASMPFYAEGEMQAGQFGGASLMPSENVDTLRVSTYLVADGSVDDE